MSSLPGYHTNADKTCEVVCACRESQEKKNRVMKCYVHTDEDAVDACSVCHKALCSSCIVKVSEKSYCQECVEKKFAYEAAERERVKKAIKEPNTRLPDGMHPKGLPWV